MQALAPFAVACFSALLIVAPAQRSHAATTEPLKFTPMPMPKPPAQGTSEPLKFTPMPVAKAEATTTALAGFVGSQSCRECHERFYQLWSTSWHGLAMQPYSDKLATEKLTRQTTEVVIGKSSYIAQTGPGQGWVVEKTPQGERKYEIQHVMGGKNVYYFLTPLDKGKLQTLPVSYDVHRKEWYDTAASAMRHFPNAEEDQPLHWTDRPYTFNTACYNCHVSQLTTNHDPKTDTYRTAWLEPGINCETCHGPAGEHNRLFRAAAKAGETTPTELGLISTHQLTVDQNNELCSTCHAKMSALSASFGPGDRFFDHFDMITLEDNDYYPDGRDLGENYTYTSWMMNPCVKGSDISCIHCHTSSGRFRFAPDQANNSCLPCHKGHVENAPAHTHHPAGSKGNLCNSCHMPMTNFARMNRSDHSFRPPMPSLTKQVGSPNACNLCHQDKDADWADRYVREWRTRDYQSTTSKWATLVADARAEKWAKLPDMVQYVKDPTHEMIVANSLIRLLRRSEDPSVTDAFTVALRDRSPLVRATAADALGSRLTPGIVKLLVKSAADNYRLVRIRAAGALSPISLDTLSEADRKVVESAFNELVGSLKARTDDAGAYYNLGNFLSSRHSYKEAIESYEMASELRPDIILALVNSSLAYNALGQNTKAEDVLRRAVKMQPSSVAAQLNLALLLGETGRISEAESAFRRLLELDPRSAIAAYNLGVIAASKGDSAAAIDWVRKAHDFRPQEPKYGYTLAFYLQQTGKSDEALGVARSLVLQHPAYADGALLLAALHEARGENEQARAAIATALSAKNLSPEDRDRLEQRLRQMQ